jgi:hypothetical protein
MGTPSEGTVDIYICNIYIDGIPSTNPLVCDDYVA